MVEKNACFILGLVVAGLMMVSLFGIAWLVILADELGVSNWIGAETVQAYFTSRAAWQDTVGNEITGYATALFFAASCVPVGLDRISRIIIRYGPSGKKDFFRRINGLQRKYLMPFHTIMSTLALGLGILHLALSTCVVNPLPELGLLLSGILVATGFLFKWRAIPTTIRKALYMLHASPVVSGILLFVLFTGHVVMDMD
jgi:hypothetical protein